jgi:type I restriction enzyme R subunit
MSAVGQREKETQARVVKLFREQLGYDYLGDWTDEENNRNIEEHYLRPFLKDQQKYDDVLINKTLRELNLVASDQNRNLYDANRDVYTFLRYGVKVKPDVGENTQTVWLIDWKNPDRNHFAIAEEVTILGENTKRPDIVLYINGIALGVLELKRSTVSVSEGIRQNLANQNSRFIRPFFSTIQIIMAGNESQGVRYAPIETPEKYYLTWKEESTTNNLLDRHLLQLCEKKRMLELIHDYIVFDAGIKKICRHNQFFGVKAAQPFVERPEGGVIWHTQGSGKSLTMVWLAKWIRENIRDPRVLIITDRTELDDQIEKVFLGVKENIERTKSGADLITKLNDTHPWLICSLIHKFAGKGGESEDANVSDFIMEMQKALPPDFRAKGNIIVFIDECHRTQSGDLHEAMKKILPDATFIGFTGTPLLKKDKRTSIETFGPYIHTYKYDEAVADGVVLDLRYEARDIDQVITSQEKIDQWFEANTQGLTDIAKAELKKRWGTMQKLLSSRSRLERIVNQILFDMATKGRLMSGRGNAMFVTDSIFSACKCYDLFKTTPLAGRCAIVTSYRPSISDIKGEMTGLGHTERLEQFEIYQNMLADYYHQPKEDAIRKAEDFEVEIKEKFVKAPGQVKLLIVVDKLLTGFDAPPATYLYIDKPMRDHGLFQAICRVNRLDGEDKDYGYIIDYRDLFRDLEKSVHDYTSEAFEGYDRKDVDGLLKNRLKKAKDELDNIREKIKALCEAVKSPRDTTAYLHYFYTDNPLDDKQIKENEPKRLALYKTTASFIRAYTNIANEMAKAGYTADEANQIREEVQYYENVRKEVKLGSADDIDLKLYEPSMRHLIDSYIQAGSETTIPFDNMSLIQLIVERGEDAIKELPKSIRENQDALPEIIVNNIRKIIVDESPINPKYYEKMSELLDALIKERRTHALGYKAYLKKIIELTRQIKDTSRGEQYPQSLDTSAKRALYLNLDKNEEMAFDVDRAVQSSMQDEWQHNPVKTRKVRIAIRNVLKDELITDRILELVKQQPEYR